MRSAIGQAKSAFNQSSNTANSAEANANQIGSTLVPGLEREFEHPTGFTPEEMNNMTVASEQGAGGAESGLKGDAALREARTRNSAGYSTALDEAARDKTRTLSEDSLNVQNESAKLAQEKQQRAGSELAGLYGTDVKETLGAQGLLPEDVNSEVNAGKSGWFQNMTELINALKPGGSTGKGGSDFSFGGG